MDFVRICLNQIYLMNLYFSYLDASSIEKMKKSLSSVHKALDRLFAFKNSLNKKLTSFNMATALFLSMSIAHAAGPVGGVVQSGAATITSSQLWNSGYKLQRHDRRT